MEESISCPVCGGELLPHIVCPSCGADITLRTTEGLEPEYKCPVCGNEAPTKFICNDCGSEFKYELILEKMSAAPALAQEKKPKAKAGKHPEESNLGDLKSGLTNGLSNGKAGKKGLTNGLASKGLTNGTGATNGMTNGLTNGLTNGTGAINGTKPVKERRKKSSKLPTVVSIAVVLLLIFGTGYMVFFSQQKGIVVDGNFSDWDSAVVKKEFQTPTDSLDLVEYTSSLTDRGLFIYLKANSPLFRSEGSRIYAFIDADNSPSTGYSINGLGADYLCKLYGSTSGLDSKGVYSYAMQPGQTDYGLYWDWDYYSGLPAAYSDNKIEMGFSSDDINSDYRMCFYTSTMDGHHQISSVNIGENAPSLMVRKTSVAQDIFTNSSYGTTVSLLKLDLFATGGDVHIESFSLDVSSNLTDVVLTDMNGNVLSSAIGNTIAFSQTIPDDSSVSYQIRAKLPDAAQPGSLVHADIVSVYSSPSAITHMEGLGAKAYIGTPYMIDIDGAFGDWDSVGTRTDPTDSDIPQRIDITDYQGVRDGVQGEAYFYLKVHGDIMAGALVPEGYIEGMPTEGNQPAPVIGEDVARIYVRTSGGDRYMVEIKGKNGDVIGSSLYVYSETGWRFLSDNVNVAKDESRMEVSLPLSEIGNPSDMSISFYTSDWEDNSDSTGVFDMTDYSQGSTRAYSSEVTPVPEFGTVILPMIATIVISLIVLRRRRK